MIVHDGSEEGKANVIHVMRCANARTDLVEALQRQMAAFDLAYAYIPADERARFERDIANRGLSSHNHDARAALVKAAS